MRPSKLHRLTLAIAAASLLIGGATRSMGVEISASAFVTNLHQYVQNGDLAAAKDALHHLQSLGIKQIKIGEEYVFIVDVLKALNDPTQTRIMLARLMESVNRGVVAMFVAENRVVASINWDMSSRDVFPTGSAG